MKWEKKLPKSALKSEAAEVLDSDGDKFIDKDSIFSWERYASIHEKECAHFTPHFFPWHRAYIYYFEEAVRTITGEKNLLYRTGM